MTDRWVIVLPVGGDPILVRCDDGESMELKSMQDIVEGYIEPVSNLLLMNYKEDVTPVMLVNEEGRLKGLQKNHAATVISLNRPSIVGNAIIMAARGEKLIGFTKEDAESLQKEIEPWA